MDIEKKMSKVQIRFVAGVMALAFIAIVVLFIIFIREDSVVKRIRLDSFMVGDTTSIKYSVETRQYNNDGSYSINGWAIKPGITYHFYNYGNDAERDRVYNNMHVGFTDGKYVYILPTKLQQRTDVSQNMNDGIDYAYCGFRSRLPKKLAETIEGKTIVLIWRNPDKTQELYYLE